MIFGRQKSSVGLDVGANSVKLVKLDHNKDGYSVSAIGIRELPPDAIVADEIRDREAVIFNIQSLIDQTDPKIRDVVVSISGHSVITDRFTIDKKSGPEADQAILFETEQRVTALVNIGHDVTNITYIADGLFAATRDVSAGTREIFDAVQKEFRLNPELTSKAMKGEMGDSIDQDMFKATIMSAADELVSGVELAFSYFRSQTKIETIDWLVLSGGGSLVPYLPEFLQSKINIPLELANPLRNIDYDPELFQYVQPEKIAPLLAVPVGLAMRKGK
jgi:Tfp pilus assembly PilM family ATPase